MPAEYRVTPTKPTIQVSAKVTIRELDGSEYQLKKRIAEQIRVAGFSRKISRGLHEMVYVSMSYALRIITMQDGACDGGKINPPRRPEGLLLYYPHKDQATLPYSAR